MAIEKVFLADKPTLDATKSNTDTIKNELALVKAYVDTLETQLGNNSQSASSNGSVHAKLKELRTLVDTVEGSLATILTKVNSNDIFSMTTLFKIIHSKISGETAQTITVISLTGKGVISSAYLTAGGASGSTMKPIIKADNVVIDGYNGTKGLGGKSIGQYGNEIILEEIKFNYSFIIQLHKDPDPYDGGNISTNINYRLV